MTNTTDLGDRAAKGEIADSGVVSQRPTNNQTAPVSELERQRRRIGRSRKGGLALKAKYGRDHFVQMGRLGGRPTWQQELAKARAKEAAALANRPKAGRPRKSEK